MLNRREMLAIGGGTLLGGLSFSLSGLLAASDRPVYGGWLDLEIARSNFLANNDRPYFRQHSAAIKGTGQNQEVLLWKFYEAVTKATFAPRFQKLGDCTGQACGLGVDTLTAVQIGLHKKLEEWRGLCSTEAIYAGSRIEIGKGAACFNRFGMPTDGSTGAWVTQYVRDYGVLIRHQYGDIDLTEYRPDLAKKWGSSNRFGVPDDLEVVSKPHPVRTITLVESWEQACDLVANGYPVVLCSNVGFTSETDAEGFLPRGREPWYHAMLLWGIDTKGKRQGGCIANSWGTTWLNAKQHRLGTPAGCFWADAKIIDNMLSQGDSLALSNYAGYVRRDLDYRLW
jgi:hypothetical protein